MIRIHFTRACAGVALAFSIAFAAQASAAEQKSLARIALPPGPESLPAVVAIERGFFDQEGVIVSTTTAVNMNSVAASLAAGSSDAAVVSQGGFLALASLKTPATAVAAGASQPPFELIGRAGGATTLAGLRGKRVGVVNGTCAAGVLPRLLDAGGVKPAEVTIDAAGPEKIVSEMESGAMEAVFGPAMWTGTLIANDGASVIESPQQAAQSTGYLCADMLMISNKVRSGDPGMTAALTRGWIRGLAYIRANPDDAARILQIYLHRNGTTVTNEVAAAAVGALNYDDPTLSSNIVNDAKYNAWGVVQAGLLQNELSVDGYFDTAIAAKELKAMEVKR